MNACQFLAKMVQLVSIKSTTLSADVRQVTKENSALLTLMNVHRIPAQKDRLALTWSPTIHALAFPE
jgi:hypothetical protein